MKLLFFLLFIQVGCHFLLKSQTNYNLSFEDWKSLTPPFGSTYEDIDGWWATVNDVKRITGDNNHLTAFKFTPAQDGNYAIRLKSTSALSTFIPGVVVTGSFSFQQQQLLQGKPFNSKPIQLKGYYQYFPVNNDSGVAYIHLSKWNANLNRRDTIAVDSLLFISQQSSWKEFQLSLDYSNFPGVIPDSIVIRFVSSVNAGFGGGKVGSELMIDHLSLEYPVSNEPSLHPLLTIYPNPFQNWVNIDSQNILADGNLEVYNLLGEKLLEDKLNFTHKTFNFEHFHSGVYLLVVKDVNKGIMSIYKIVKY